MTAPALLPEDVERVARAICQTDCTAACRTCTKYREHARAAIAAWNRRPAPAAMQDRRPALDAIITALAPTGKVTADDMDAILEADRRAADVGTPTCKEPLQVPEAARIAEGLLKHLECADANLEYVGAADEVRIVARAYLAAVNKESLTTAGATGEGR